jgi:hypothetical protein
VVTRRILFRCAAVALVLVAQWSIVSVPAIDTDKFDAWARELQRTKTWRYGYVLPHHGAVLVKTRWTGSALPFVPIAPDDRLSGVMDRELRLGARKAAFELLFYGSLWILAMTGLPRIARAMGGAAPTRGRWAAAVGTATALFPTAALAPYLIAAYGEPLFSTWRGPGALSYSGPFPPTAALGTSITYRHFFAPLGERGALWAIAGVFYGVGAAIVAYVADTRERR